MVITARNFAIIAAGGPEMLLAYDLLVWFYHALFCHFRTSTYLIFFPFDKANNSLKESTNAGTLTKVREGCSFGLNLTSLVTLAMTTNRKRTDGRTISKRVNIKWRLLTQAYFSVSMPACLENLIA